MPRAAKTKVPEAPAMMAVRMLTGVHAGQVVRVSREEGVRLCGGWQPQAEPVAMKPADARETR
jgi:hypothetical protein